ncbi:MAG: hypothetical protein ACFFBD_07265 [Candidatus Hodarchaeota archaeon]
MTYRNEVQRFERKTRWTFWQFLPLTVLVFTILTGIGFLFNSVGLLGRTVIERKVFEHSYQRSEALRSQIATDEATIAEIERKLVNPNLDSDTRFNLEAQLSAARIRISTAERKQQ